MFYVGLSLKFAFSFSYSQKYIIKKKIINEIQYKSTRSKYVFNFYLTF